MGIMLREVAADNFMGIQKVLTQPVMTFAPFVLFRGLMEMAALSIWLLSVKIEEIERTQRILTYRWYALNEELKYAHTTNDLKYISSVVNRINKLQQDAELVSILPVCDKKGITIGYGERIPPRTVIINNCLNGESIYRLFSAISHGQSWAIIQSSFREQTSNIEVYEKVKGSILEKNINPIAYMFLCIKSIEYLTRAEKEQFLYWGWDEKPLLELESEMMLKLKVIGHKHKILT